MQRRFPKVVVEMDRIFIADGQIWTSAGMAAGIDMALGMVEHDLERDDARTQTFRIVGEDEANPAQASISHSSPVAMVTLSIWGNANSKSCPFLRWV